MDKRKLGDTGFEITPVGYGAWAIGGLGYGDQDEGDAHAAIDAYLQGGGRFIDTARVYGVSEIMIGRRLQAFDRADEVFVASKSGSTHPPIVATDLETSRFCLQRDCVDLYYIHVPPSDLEEVRRLLDAYERLKNAGRTRLIGISCRGVGTQEEADLVRGFMADGRVDVLQLGFNFAQTEADGLIDEAREKGIGVVTRMNLQGGLFTGKYKPGHRFDDEANDWRAGISQDILDRILQLVADLEGRFVGPPYETLAQVALAFPLTRPGVSAVIPGGRSAAQVRANLSIDDLPPMDRRLADELEAAAGEIGELFARSREQRARRKK